MKNIALLAVAGLAGTVAAQGVTLTFSADATEVDFGETMTWTVSASFTGYDDDSAYYGGFTGLFAANDNTLGTAGALNNLLAGTGTLGSAAGADVTGINVFNSALLGTDDNSNPINIFSFEVVAGNTAGTLTYSADGTNSVFPDDGSFTLADEYAGTTISDSVRIVPAPGAAALLGLGGLVAARRRR